MAVDGEVRECPGGCGNQVHQNATMCQHCGYRPEMTRFEELLGGLNTVCSILTGFCLASLVTLVSGDSRTMESLLVQCSAGLWIISSVLLLVALILGEFIRRQDRGTSRIQLSRQDGEQLWRQCEQLLWIVTVALFSTGISVVLLGFHFSLLHGFAGSIALLFGMSVVIRSLRS